MLAEAENLQHSCTVVIIYDHVRSNVQPVKPALAAQQARSVYMDNRNTNAVTGTAVSETLFTLYVSFFCLYEMFDATTATATTVVRAVLYRVRAFSTGMW